MMVREIVPLSDHHTANRRIGNDKFAMNQVQFQVYTWPSDVVSLPSHIRTEDRFWPHQPVHCANQMYDSEDGAPSLGSGR
jgi:hypothetical protein